MKNSPIFSFCGFDCEVSFSYYLNGAVAIKLIAANTERNKLLDVYPGEPIATATVNADDCKLVRNIDNNEVEVLLKDWSENEGIVDALVKAGIVELTGEIHKFAHTVGQIARLNPAYLSPRIL